MLQPRREGVLVHGGDPPRWQDRTAAVVRHGPCEDGRRYAVQFDDRAEPFRYAPGNVVVLREPRRVEIRRGERVEVAGTIWTGITEIHEFCSEIGPWRRLFYVRDATVEVFVTRPADEVRLVTDSAGLAGPAEVLAHWRAVLSGIPADDPLHGPWKRMTFLHPDSALARYLSGAPVKTRPWPELVVHPFRGNLSQQQAIENALSRSMSVIEGPPGTGKTQTILNLVANLLVTGVGTVGVVSYNNAAVDNVREKLEQEGFGHVIADLGRREKREAFFQRRGRRPAEAGTCQDREPPPGPRLGELAEQLRHLQAVDRRRAECRARLEAYRLEFRHFVVHEGASGLPELDGLPLLRRSAERVLTYLAESELDRRGPGPGWITRVRRYFRYGSTRDLDPHDSDVVLGLQRAYYTKRIAEIEAEVEEYDAELDHSEHQDLVEEFRRLSLAALGAALDQRNGNGTRGDYAEQTYRLGTNFVRFVREHPVVLSTCHALRASLPDGYLLDYLVIDEASQCDVLTAALAMASCRNLVVVGDSRQLQPIAKDRHADVPPPSPAYDCREQSILSSVVAVYGGALPRTLLVEHYRCAPAIIDFCNRSFYDGELIPYTVAEGDRPAMVLRRTSEGNHMRQHVGGGRSNQREIDVVVQEVVPEVADEQIGVIAPYRRQVDRLASALDDFVQPSTVHQVQGREQQVTILTTVLDESRQGRMGLRFVDDPHLINVAVSRATRMFILVTSHETLPRSRHLRELREHILYQDPGVEPPESAIVSIFDLLYRDYSQRLVVLAGRLRGEMRYKSEDIAWTVLSDLLEESAFRHLEAVPQVLLRNLVADPEELSEEQQRYVRHRSSVDFVVYRRVSRRPVLAVEVDGFAFHENNVRQLERDALKNAILARRGLPLLRLPTTGSGEQERIRAALERHG